MLLLLERYVVIDNWNSQRLTFQVPPHDLQSFNHHLLGCLRLKLIRDAHLRDWQNIKLPLVALHVTFESLTSPKR